MQSYNLLKTYKGRAVLKNFIFDFGQVIVHFDAEFMTSQYIKDKDDIDMVKAVVFDRLYWDRLDKGDIEDSEVLEGIKSRLPQRLWESAQRVYVNWYYNLPFVDGMLELIETLKKEGKRLYVISDISRGFANGYKNVPKLKELFSKFDGLVFSGTIGITKPDSRIFEYLLNTYNLKAEDCFFIDDRESNINGAKEVGMQGYVFDGNAKKLCEFIRTL